MRKSNLRVVFIIVLAFFSQFLSSCKKSHETPVKPKLSFSNPTMTVKESDGTVDVNVELDKPSPEAISITYELAGTAKDKVTAGNSSYDYEIPSSYLEVKIPKGQSTGSISIKLYSDFALEDDETIEITLKSVDSDNIEITRDDNIVITVKQEDGLIVLLEWPNPTVDSLADMDLILRVGANTSTWDGVLTGSVSESFTGPEFMFIPYVVDYPAYGVSYTYYDGTFDPLHFTVTFIDLIDGLTEAAANQEVFTATYHSANMNKWTDVTTTQVVQTFEKTSGTFGSPSIITVPVSGSRVISNGHLESALKKQIAPDEPSRLILQLLKNRKK